MDQLHHRLEEIHENVLRLWNKAEKQALLNMAVFPEVLIVCWDQVKVELEGMLALMAFHDDIHRYHKPGAVDLVRSAVFVYVRKAIEGIDLWIAELLQEEEDEEEEDEEEEEAA